jgi:acyl carrier protein
MKLKTRKMSLVPLDTLSYSRRLFPGATMALPSAVLQFLQENAQRQGSPLPKPGEDLFKTGALDSFALVDFVSLLEQHCGVTVPDSDVNPEKFQTLEAIEKYISLHQA